MKKILALLAFAVGFSLSAQAGIMIEPYLGYETGDVKTKLKTGDTREYTDTTAGSALGLRLGYKFLLPWAALDYTMGTGTYKDESSNVSPDYSKTSMGAVVGVDLPIIRAWAGYGFSNEATIKYTGGDVKLKGTYTKVGVGFTPLPLASLNVEYKINTYTKWETGGASFTVNDYYDTYSHNTIIASVSIPFNL